MHYEGGCHCGAVRFGVDIELSNTLTCNCSYCTQRGSILAFTSAENFTLEKGEDSLTEYRFNSEKIQHLFCSVCGMESFARGAMPDGTKMAAINVRCLNEVDLDELDIKQVDGRSR